MINIYWLPDFKHMPCQKPLKASQVVMAPLPLLVMVPMMLQLSQNQTLASQWESLVQM
jgi:hypothetical protein